MALNTKQKRGSVIGMTSPDRQWLAEPDGAFSPGDRMSLLKLAAAVPPSAPVPLPTLIGTIFRSAIIAGVR